MLTKLLVFRRVSSHERMSTSHVIFSTHIGLIHGMRGKNFFKNVSLDIVLRNDFVSFLTRKKIVPTSFLLSADIKSFAHVSRWNF